MTLSVGGSWLLSFGARAPTQNREIDKCFKNLLVWPNFKWIDPWIGLVTSLAIELVGSIGFVFNRPMLICDKKCKKSYPQQKKTPKTILYMDAPPIFPISLSLRIWCMWSCGDSKWVWSWFDIVCGLIVMDLTSTLVDNMSSTSLDEFVTRLLCPFEGMILIPPWNG